MTKIGPKEARLAQLRGQPRHRRLASGVPKVAAPVRDPKYLRWLGTRPSALTGKLKTDGESIVAAHVGGGMGAKRGDDEAIPLEQSLHALEHQRGTAWLIRTHASDEFLISAARAWARDYRRKYLNDPAAKR